MIRGLNHITLSVSNLERSFCFYKDILGMTPKFKSNKTAYFQNGNLWFALSLDEKTRKGSLPEYSHIAFKVLRKDFKNMSDILLKNDVEIFKDNNSEGDSVYFLDPDGHKLEIHIGDLDSRLNHYRDNKAEDFEFFDDSYTRKASANEATFLSELALRSKAIWGYSPDFIEACRPHIYVDESYIKDWPVKVLINNGEIVGFHSLKMIGDENRLDNLWIEPEKIKKGFGRLLYLDAVKEARSLGWDYFRLAGEPDAIPFYNKMGAVLIGEVQSRLKKDLFLPHMEMRIL
jgi:catechol 2,3-dioxygenase-like lactoylglutathione lyase family enzyme/GNAT superfamily N-acetyltransferase